MTLHTEYYNELRLLKSTPAKVWFGLLLLVLLVIPTALEGYLLNLLTLAAIHVIIAIGLNLLTGYTGQISLGHAGFIGIGAYTSALLMLKLHLPFALALLAAGGVAGVFGFLVGLPALRLTGPYLAIATLGFGIAVGQILVKWESLSGGSLGIHPPKPSIGPLVFTSETHFYFLSISTMLLMTIGAANLIKSKIGRAFVAIRESEVAALAMGVNLTLYKTLAFAVSAFYAGIGGSLMGHLIGYISPDAFNLLVSIYFLSMIVIGGLASILGSILGSILLTALPYFLSGIKNLPMVIYGASLILIIIFEPYGLTGHWMKLRLYWRMWPF
ncbi:MAG: branched-chain amino acid ABC transporter permease [candidate division NC10 bacterium]|nr:branched-chain amino acid ABC transporter permease [candidate division NC10 bacterium]